jgi:cytidylate kinase
MQNKIIITIDGYSSCGKSTLAKQLARRLDYVHIDSGAMYRAITLYLLRNDIHLDIEADISKAIENINLSFVKNDFTGTSDMYLNDENVESMIREMLVSERVSDVATHKSVRDFAVAQQRKIGINKGIIMDGRDIGTTVFAHAELKLFMTADVKTRVERRFKEMFAINPLVSLEEVKHNLEMRDYIDSNREISPLRKADDAVVLDNTLLTMDEQLDIALQLAYERIALPMAKN